MKKPLEFKIEYVPQACGYVMTFYYEDGTQKEIFLGKHNLDVDLIDYIGLSKQSLNSSRHYHIDDLYGGTVKNDREGL